MLLYSRSLLESPSPQTITLTSYPFPACQPCATHLFLILHFLTVLKIPFMLFYIAVVHFHSWVFSSLGLSQTFFIYVQTSLEYAPRNRIAGSYMYFPLCQITIPSRCSTSSATVGTLKDCQPEEGAPQGNLAQFSLFLLVIEGLFMCMDHLGFLLGNMPVSTFLKTSFEI